MALGLTSAEAERLHAEGKGNDVNLKTSRSLLDIFRANFLSLANVILLVISGILILVGSFADAVLTGGVVAMNVVIGSFQEFRSKRQLDQIALLNRPRVTVIRDGAATEINQTDVVVGDAVLLRAGDQAVVDGRMVQREGDKVDKLDMDESLLTGESDLITKRQDDEILSGSFVVTGEGVYIAEKVGDESFAQKITAGAREFTQAVTPLQAQIGIIVRILVVAAIGLSIMLALSYGYQELRFSDGVEDAAVVISLVPQGLLLMITVAYALGAVRIARKGALVQQMNAVESLSNVNVLCLDKTGTLTTNRIIFDAIHPIGERDASELHSLVGDYITSTGAKNRTAEALAEAVQGQHQHIVTEIPFSSARKWAAASFDANPKPGTYVFGAAEMILPSTKVSNKADIRRKINQLADQGLRVLLFAYSDHITQPIPDGEAIELPPNLVPLCLISFSDELRPHVRDVLDNFRRARIQLKLISGDNPDTVAALAYQAGFRKDKDRAVSGMALAKMDQLQFERAVREHNIFGRITPEQKQDIVDVLRKQGHYVAMMGDGVNDVLSLKKAQVGIAMESGSQATRNVADIVLLQDNFGVLPEAFLEGQRILNGMNNSTRLFLTRTLYTALLIIIAGFIGSDFPFTPRHNALLTTIPLGIPAFFLVYWAKTGQPKKNLLTSVGEFVFPAGFSLMVVTVFIWVLYLTAGSSTSADEVEYARSVLTVAAMIGGLLIIILSEHEREEYQNGDIPFVGDVRRVILTVVMASIFAIVMLVPALREFFEMLALSTRDWIVVTVSMLIWAVGLSLMWRYDILERIMIPNYSGLPREDKGQHRDNNVGTHQSNPLPALNLAGGQHNREQRERQPDHQGDLNL